MQLIEMRNRSLPMFIFSPYISMNCLLSIADQVHANEKVTLPGLKFQGTYCLAASERTEPPKGLILILTL